MRANGSMPPEAAFTAGALKHAFEDGMTADVWWALPVPARRLNGELGNRDELVAGIAPRDGSERCER